MADPINVLILCTGNSARSIIGEVLISAKPGLKGYSAGSTPKTDPHPMALDVLQSHGHSVAGLTSKSWDVFATPDAPRMHVVITVCDNAAGETCPYWPGDPVRGHWGLPDPAAVEGAGQREAFEATYAALNQRASALAGLSFTGANVAELAAELHAIHSRFNEV